MTQFTNFAKLLVLISFLASPALAQPVATPTPTGAAAGVKLADRILGKADAPVTVNEYVSLTCSHCAEFTNDTLPVLEKTYVDSGKVKFILHDFPLDGAGLKAAVIARCMPEDEFYPFVKVLYKNQASWAFGNADPEKAISQYARLGGLSDEKAKACLADTGLQDAIIAERTDAAAKYNIEATPTFIVTSSNGDSETIKGAVSAEKFSATLDVLLAAKH
jgi:protein-disulfide isomerase